MAAKKRPQGRPPKKAKDRHDYILPLRLTKDQYARLKKIAHSQGTSMAEYIRAILDLM